MGDQLKRGWDDERAQPPRCRPIVLKPEAFERFMREWERVCEQAVTDEEELRLP